MTTRRPAPSYLAPASAALLATLLVPGSAAAGRVLTLEEALQTAAAHQPQLAAANADAGAAGERVGEARAGYLPRVDAQAQYQRATTNFILAPLMVNTPLTKGGYQARNELGPGDTADYLSFGVTAKQLLYDFGKTTGAITQAENAADASRAEAATTALTVALNVRVAYFGVLAAQELVAVGEETVRNQTGHVEQIRRFVDLGSRARFDLSSAELNLANAQLVVVRARNALALAKVRLHDAMGTDQTADFDVVAPPATASEYEDEPLDRLLEQATQSRPELRRAAAQLRLQEAARRTAVAAYLPSLSAVGSFTGGKVGGYEGSYDWYVGVGMSWNLFNGLFTRHRVREVAARLAAATARRDALRLKIRSELAEQRLAVTEAEQRVEVVARAEATAHERLRLAEDRYRAGAGDVLELDDAQVAYAGAQAQRVQAHYDLAVARARLARAVGR